MIHSILFSLFLLSAAACTDQTTDKAPAAEPGVVEQTVNEPIQTRTEPSDFSPPSQVAESKPEDEKMPPKSVLQKTENSSSPSPESIKAVQKTTETSRSEIPVTDPQPKAQEAPNTQVIENDPTDPPTLEVPAPITTEAKAQEELEEPARPNAVRVELSHAEWDALLKKYVGTTGKVNYQGFKTEKAKLQTYLDHLADNPPQSDWSRNKAMAYWINAYNAFTVKLIVDNYPVSSITKLHSGKPWDVKWIKIGDKTYTLNNIENDILRPKYKDPRIHFAVNCAAKSCPPLLNRAWTADNLESNFEQQAKAFINNSKYNSIAAGKVTISKIFEWYSGDFGNIIDYLNKYSTTKINKNAKVSYMEYDWTLNQ